MVRCWMNECFSRPRGWKNNEFCAKSLWFNWNVRHEHTLSKCHERFCLSWELATQPSISCSECVLSGVIPSSRYSPNCVFHDCVLSSLCAQESGLSEPSASGNRGGQRRNSHVLGIYWASLYSPLLFPMALRSSWYFVDFRDRELEAYKIKLTWLRLHS